MKKLILLLTVLILAFSAAEAFASPETPSEAEAPFRYIWDTASGGMTIPKLYQIGETEILYGSGKNGKSIESSGCGAVCVAMVGRYLTDNNYTPRELFLWAIDSKYFRGNGFSYKDMIALAEHYGFTGKWTAATKSRIRKALRANKPIIARMGAGLFTDGGHYIVLTGISKAGMVSVNDPNSEYFSTQAFTLDSIMHDIKSMMVCEKPEAAEE